jgi:hypothetical protein
MELISRKKAIGSPTLPARFMFFKNDPSEWKLLRVLPVPMELCESMVAQNAIARGSKTWYYISIPSSGRRVTFHHMAQRESPSGQSHIVKDGFPQCERAVACQDACIPPVPV